MFEEVMVYNVALQALLIDYQTQDPSIDTNKAVRTLRTFFPMARSKVLADLDLDKTSTKVKLELLAATHPHYEYVYKYPANCAKFRRIVSPFATDNNQTRIPAKTETVGTVPAIMTNEFEAWAEIQPTDLNLSALNPSAGICMGLMLAYLSSALITGKGSKDFKANILQEYILMKAEAMEDDQNENVDSTPDEFKSEFVQARLGSRGWRGKTM